MGVRAKGVQGIRTLASILGTGAHSNERHVHQFQLASLELERTRQARVRVVALHRIRDIDARLVEIDDLIRKHHGALGLKGDDEASQGHPAANNHGGAVPEKRRVLRY